LWNIHLLEAVIYKVSSQVWEWIPFIIVQKINTKNTFDSIIWVLRPLFYDTAYIYSLSLSIHLMTWNKSRLLMVISVKIAHSVSDSWNFRQSFYRFDNVNRSIHKYTIKIFATAGDSDVWYIQTATRARRPLCPQSRQNAWWQASKNVICYVSRNRKSVCLILMWGSHLMCCFYSKITFVTQMTDSETLENVLCVVCNTIH
jgi:hypothetical protein